MCHDHLRTVASECAGLCSNVSDEILVESILAVHEHRDGLDDLRRSHRRWFLQPYRPHDPLDAIRPYRMETLPTFPARIDRRRIFRRYASSKELDTFLRAGTIIFGGQLRHLKSPRFTMLFRLEFEVYKHHADDETAAKSMGFLSMMFYNLTQQLLRQQPRLALLNMAYRDDEITDIVCYPYITKYVASLIRTGFLHLDCNLRKLLEDGIGQSLIGCGISLLAEESHNCTVMVPRSHLFAREWVQRIHDRSQTLGSGATTNAETLYTAADPNHFQGQVWRGGHPRSMPGTGREDDLSRHHPRIHVQGDA